MMICMKILKLVSSYLHVIWLQPKEIDGLNKRRPKISNMYIELLENTNKNSENKLVRPIQNRGRPNELLVFPNHEWSEIQLNK